MALSESNYLVIPAFARTRLDLKGNELLVFSLIHGFSQDKNSRFTGSIAYICEWVGCSNITAMDTLKKLLTKNLIIKEEGVSGQPNRYRSNSFAIMQTPPVKNLDTPVKNLDTPPVKNLEGFGQESSPNTIINSNQYTNNNIAENSATGKLFSTENTTAKKLTSQQEKFIWSKFAIVQEFGFAQDVQAELMNFLTMLAEMRALISDLTFRAQLTALIAQSKSKQLDIVRSTITRGWKSLIYQIEQEEKTTKPSFDTAAKSKVQMKDPKNDTRHLKYEGGPKF